LILVFRINKPKIKTVNVSNLAEDRWLEALTGWPDDEESVKLRSRDLWFWLKELEKKGKVLHTGRQWFSLNES
jgi:hypothetical protein